MVLPTTIAVDGPAGSGKSSISFALAQRLGYLFVDTGAFYRAITLLALEQSISLDDPLRLTALAENADLDLSGPLLDDGRQYTILAGQRDITPLLSSTEVEACVSVISAVAGVRQALLDLQRSIGARGRVIMAGRDIGTVVLPDADLKLYLDASLDQRASRRYQQRLTSGQAANLDEIRAGLNNRDTIDSGRDVAPLLRAPDAIYLDTSDLSLDEAVDAAYRIVCDWNGAHDAV
ncbi:MAG TPA: (d)CMP kinase [Aggregatilinea sp.]|uniref:(d)CMP kinase n=1 Tax=Aggregatilinea sp. TaxID=2806333 RepID=UPI002C43ADE6|nr:(d)CMP kinase [Aggregatilinea sp.]HML20096.1 (d)CMP kinase [Aggregatilinea sp.]